MASLAISSAGEGLPAMENSNPKPAIESAILDGFADVIWRDALAGCQIGYGAGDFKNAVVGARAEVEVFHSVAEHFERGVVERAEFFDLAVGHPGVGGSFFLTGEPIFLDTTRLKHTIENRRGGFRRAAAGEFLERHGGRFDMDVDAVEKRA